MSFLRQVAVGMLMLSAASQAMGREWRDTTGKFSVEADLVAASDDRVVLQRKDGKLVTVEVAHLSKEDREYLATKEAAVLGGAGDLQTWTMKEGWKVTGRIVGYGRKEVEIQRKRGKIYVNDRLFENLPELYQRMVPRIVAHFEKQKFEDAKAFTKWVVAQKGEPRSYVVDGVLLELENGDEYGVPFLFFSEEDMKLLKPGWDRWLAAREDEERQRQEDLYLQAQAEAYQRDRAASQQIAAMQLLMTAVDAGVVDLWEVALQPKNPALGLPIMVVVPARNSQQAITAALSKNPGYVVGGARKLN